MKSFAHGFLKGGKLCLVLYDSCFHGTHFFGLLGMCGEGVEKKKREREREILVDQTSLPKLQRLTHRVLRQKERCAYIYNRNSTVEYTMIDSQGVDPHVTRACPYRQHSRTRAHIVFLFDTAPWNSTVVDRHEARRKWQPIQKNKLVHMRTRHDSDF